VLVSVGQTTRRRINFLYVNDSVSNLGFPEPGTRLLAIFYYPKPVFFQPRNPVMLKKLELLLHSNISNSDNTEVAD